MTAKLSQTEELLQKKEDEWQEKALKLQKSKEYLEQQTSILQQNTHSILEEVGKLETKCVQLAEQLQASRDNTGDKNQFDMVELRSERDKFADELIQGASRWKGEKENYDKQLQRLEDYNKQVREKLGQAEQDLDRSRNEMGAERVAQLEQLVTTLRVQSSETSSAVQARDRTILQLTEEIAALKGSNAAKMKLKENVIAKLADLRGVIGCEYHARKNTPGVVVISVAPGLSAEEAGLTVGDIIESVNGIELKSAMIFKDQLVKCKPGDRIRLQVKRNGEPKEIAVEVGVAKLVFDRFRVLLRVAQGNVTDEDLHIVPPLLQVLSRPPPRLF